MLNALEILLLVTAVAEWQGAKLLLSEREHGAPRCCRVAVTARARVAWGCQDLKCLPFDIREKRNGGREGGITHH